MKSFPTFGSLRSIIVRLTGILIALTGMTIIALEVTSLWENTSSVSRQFILNQQKQLDLLESELESEIRHLVQIFPAFAKSQELQKKIVEVTLVGPYFVYSPQHYGQAIDYWDRVQILKKQVWMTNYFLPLLQSQQMDFLGVYLFDPHDNLLRNSIVPFVELQQQEASFYSYPVKGLFHALGRHSLTQLNKLTLSGKYFDQVIYHISEKDSLYSALGFQQTTIPYINISGNEFLHQKKIRIKKVTNGLILENVITINGDIYNWKVKKRESTAVVTFIGRKHLNGKYLKDIRDKFGSDDLVIVTKSGDTISSRLVLEEPLSDSRGFTQVDTQTYRYYGKDFQSEPLESTLKLFVLTKQDHITRSSSHKYKSIVVTALITVLLGIMVWFYFKTDQKSARQENGSESDNVQWNNPGNGNTFNRPIAESAENYLLIEDQGKSQTIELKDISHIRVTDHYCTIIYCQEDQWKSWMIMEPLKTFETRYSHLLLKINRSTLINPERIEKIQLSQRKLTMQGEPELLLTISLSSLEFVKSIFNPTPNR